MGLISPNFKTYYKIESSFTIHTIGTNSISYLITNSTSIPRCNQTYQAVSSLLVFCKLNKNVHSYLPYTQASIICHNTRTFQYSKYSLITAGARLHTGITEIAKALICLN